jgi:hypothetical protein
MGMAKRKYSKRSKIEPAVMTLTFATPGSGAARSYIDLSQVASLVNRRFYRQGINWAVAGFKVASQRTGAVNIFKVPNTWVLSNAWEKSMRTWMKMNREALAQTESVRPKFLDFKIYADDTHHKAGYAANLLPLDSAGNAATPGEWKPSMISYPDNTTSTGITREAEFIAVGSSYNGAGASGEQAVSMIEGYAASRGLPNVLDPNTPDDAADAAGSFPENWMAAIFNEGTDQIEEVLEDLINDNNIAPYPFENDGVNLDTMYPGGANQLSALEWHDFVQIYESNATNGIGIQRLKGGNFPCGLVCVDWTPDESANLIIQIDLVPGNHRGYLCEPMTEM